MYGITSNEQYPDDRNVYPFDDINIELYIDYYEKSYLNLIRYDITNMNIVVPVIITHLKTYGELRDKSLEYPKYIKHEYSSEDVLCCIIT